MGYISKQIETAYKNKAFKRRDDDGSLFYFNVDDFPGLKREEYCFKTKKGHALRGYFYSYEVENKDRLIIFDHGMGNGHRAYMQEINMLASRGYLVYSYDHTGCTESEGEHIMGLSGSLFDLDCCVSAMLSKGFLAENISVVGHSWGAFSTLNILHFYPNLRSIVALSGFISVKDMLMQVIPGLIAPFRSMLYTLEAEINPDHYDKNAVETLSQAKSPALIIHSVDDNAVSTKIHYNKLQKELSHKDNITFITLKGKFHNPNYTLDAVSYKEEFFKAYTKRTKNGIKDMEAHRVFLDSFDWKRMTKQDDDLWCRIFDFLK